MKTVRDEWLLPWIGEQMVVRLDQLQRLLGRDPQNKERNTLEEGKVSVSSAKDVVRRWVRDGLVVSQVIYHRQPAYLWLTMKGQREAGLPYQKPFSGKTTRLRHYCYVNEARLWCEHKYGMSIEWVSERRLVAQKDFVKIDTPAGVVEHYLDGLVRKYEDDELYTVGVEVEISNKDKTRTIEILTALAGKYDNIAYFVIKDTLGSVGNRIRQLSEHDQEVFQVIELEEQSY